MFAFSKLKSDRLIKEKEKLEKKHRASQKKLSDEKIDLQKVEQYKPIVHLTKDYGKKLIKPVLTN